MTPRWPLLLVVLALLAGACSGAGGAGDGALVAAETPSAEAVTTVLGSTTTAVRPTSTVPPATTTTTEPPPTTTTTTLPPKTRLVVSAVGDTNVDPDYIPAFRSKGYDYAFSGLQDIFLEDDLTIVNFECASSTLGRPVKQRFNFNCDIDALPVLRANGVEVANLANNHGADFGEEALLDTKANLQAAGIAPVGAGANIAEASTPAIFEINGWTVAVLGFNGVVPWQDWIATEDDPGMADGNDAETMAATVAAAAEMADLVFVTVHWGVELDLKPRPEDIRAAHMMIEAGADAIFGHHPHRLQALEFYEGKPIAWSLGNFVWPRLSRQGAKSAIAQVIIEPDGTIEACLIPVDIESHGHPVVQVDYQGHCTW